MPDEPWFNYYRRGWQMQIVPRNAKGWASLAALMAIILAPTLPLSLLGDAISPWLIVAYVALVIVLTLLWVRWAISRAQRVDLDDIDCNYDDYLEWKRRNGRD